MPQGVGTMSSRLGWSLFASGVVLAVWLVALGGLWARSAFGARRGRVRGAVRLEHDLGIALPPEAADRIERRLRRRTMTAVVVAGPGFAAWTLWYWYSFMQVPRAQYRPPTVSPMIAVMPVWALGGVAFAAAHVYDLMRTARGGGRHVARIVEPRLGDAVPPVFLWSTRLVGLLPAAAGLVWLLAPVSVQHGDAPAHPHPVLFIGAAVLGPVGVAATEAAQRRILNGRQNAQSARELAFDDALRVQTVLAVMIVPWVACVALAASIVTPLTHFGSWSGAEPVMAASTFGMVPFYILPGTLRAKWASRYYLRRFAAHSRLAPPPAAERPATAC